MAACVDKWNPAYSCHRISRSIYRFMPDCTVTAPAGAPVNGNGGDEVWEELYGEMVHCFLYYKGFLALQAHRAAHALWSEGRRPPALLLQSRASEVFGVDIHPGARIGGGILLDHATGVVIGETAVIGDDVSILHGVTLGGTGKACGDRHPKVGDGVLIGAGASVLGNVRIGDGAKIGAGAVVLRDVACGTTAVGNPAKPIGKKAAPSLRPEEQPGVTMEQRWSDYVI
ncbi:unnamed protein product [Triticum turgidum subsp. durum]|uniref:serine O-acetyltransferase n=1 Tax=Triticum turgidum subsp. durum TaxID=4567 RepID=A0A9R0T7R4_TRITD|nr:unnamed protein product [Triticum turgidum subsp. durum]